MNDLYLEIVTLSSKDDLVSLDLSILVRDKDDIVEEAVFIVVDFLEILHELQGVLLSDETVRGEDILRLLGRQVPVGNPVP